MPDPDLKIRSRGGAGGGEQSRKKFFWALRASVWSKNKGGPGWAGGGGGGGARGPPAPPPPPLRYATEDGQASEVSKKPKNVVEKALLPSMIRTFRWINS